MHDAGAQRVSRPLVPRPAWRLARHPSRAGSIVARLRGLLFGMLHAPMRLAPSADAPLPLWMIFPVIFAALYLTHLSLLRLPYFWDEAGYYIPAAWDFFRTGSLIPSTTAANSHPPLESVYLALWWRVCGFHPAITREAVLMVASLGLLAVWRLAMRLIGSPVAAFWTVLLTGLYPIWFAQSTLAHADIFAAAATLWALVYAVPSGEAGGGAASDGRRNAYRPVWLAALWFSAAALAKETSIVTPLALAAFELGAGWGKARAVRQAGWIRAGAYSLCLLPLGAWYVYVHARTGSYFGDAEFVRYNATSTIAPLRVLAAFGHRLLHLTAHMNMFVPVLCTAAALLLDPVRDAAGRLRARIRLPEQARIYTVLLANALAFSVLGGALLTRYLLPMYPLVLLTAVSTFHRRARYWQGLAAFSAAAFLVALFVDPPYGFAAEDNLCYARVIRLHQRAIHELAALYPGSTVLTAWPVTDELTRPELGYVKIPFDVARLDDFTAAQIAKAAREPGAYSSALVFSTKDEPAALPFHLNNPAVEEEYFGLHRDLSPAEIAKALDGRIAWSERDGAEWAAVIRFHRAVEARLYAGQRKR